MQETWVRSLGWEDPLEKGKATQYSGLENPMDCIVHRITKSQTQLSELHFHMLVKLKILQAKLQQYVNHELPDVLSWI